MGTQSDWRWCRNCRALFFSKGPSTCPFNGGLHDGLGSAAYVAYFDIQGDRVQQGWRWCRKCQVMFYAHGRVSSGVCANGGQHDATGSGSYGVISGVDVHPGYTWLLQRDWRWCSKCDSLFHGSGSGVCPAGGGGHRDGSGGDYTLLFSGGAKPPEMSAITYIGAISLAGAGNFAPCVTPAPPLGGDALDRIVQPDWRRCRTCQALFFSNNPSRCPGGVAHDAMGSKPYFLYHGVTGDALQEHWRWCNKCQGVFFADGVDAGGACPAGGPHDGNGSSDYALLHNVNERPEYQGAYEHRWRWCSKCQGLFNNDSGHGLCPVGGPHVDGVGTDYLVLCKSDVSVTAATVNQAAAIDINRAAVLSLANALSISARSGGYDWARSWSLPEAGRGVLTFTAHAQSDVHIVLSTQPGGGGDKYEIVVGGWGNTRTVIRRGVQGPELAAADLGLGAPGKANVIWVSVDQASRKIVVGRGPVGKGAMVTLNDQGLPALRHFTFSSWNTPIQYSNIATGPLTELALPARNAAYDWSRAWSLPEPGWGVITFNAKGTNDAILAISTLPGGAGEKYEIVIGGWVNNRSVIRRGIGGPELTSAPVGLASTTESNQLWVALDRSTGKIQVGRGAPGQDVFLSYTDPAFLATAQHFTFTSWNAPVEYTAIATRGPADVLSVPARTGAYDWGRTWSLPEPGRGVVTFTAQTSNDVHIAFSTQPGGAGERYEVVIGGWANGRSVLRRGTGGTELAAANVGLKSPGGQNPLWVSLDRTRGRIEVGRGAPGEDVILGHTDPAFIVGARHFTFSSWNAPVAYTAITARQLPDVARVEAQCKLIVDHVQKGQPLQRFQTVLVPRRADGSTMPNSKLRFYASEPVTIEREANGAVVTHQVGVGAPVELTTSPSGRCRFTIAPLPDRLTVPLLMVQSEAMERGQWSVFSPDRDLHQKLANLTGEQMTSIPKGKSAPLIDVRPPQYATPQAQIQAEIAETYAQLIAWSNWTVAMFKWNGDPATMPKRPQPRVTQADADALASAVSQVMQVCAKEGLAAGDQAGLSFDAGAEAEPSVLAAAHPGRPTHDQAGEVLPVFEVDPLTPLKRTLPRRAAATVPAATEPAAAEPTTEPAATEPTTEPAAVSFGIGIPGLDSVIDAAEDVYDTAARGASDLAHQAVDGATGLVRSAAEVAAQVARTASEAISASTGAIGSAAQFMNTMGAAAQVLIRNADAAVLQPAAQFSADVMRGARQLAIDTTNGIVVIALIAKNGVYELVKTVIEEVEQAALVVGAFFEQVGLKIKTVIEFLLMLFDWGDILRTQRHLMEVIHQHLSPANFRAIVDEQRGALADMFQAVRTNIAALGPAASGGRTLPGLPNILDHLPSFGGPFGYLFDKFESHFTGMVPGLPGGALSLSPQAIAAAEKFHARMVDAPLIAMLGDPTALLKRNPDELLQLALPYVEDAIKLLESVAGTLLDASVEVMTVSLNALQIRHYIPVVTELIEWLVFDNEQELSLLSLFTLVAAALLTVLYKVTLDTSDAPFDAYESAVSFDTAESDPTRTPEWRASMTFTVLGSFFGLLQMITGGLAVYTGDTQVLPRASSWFGLLGPIPSIPVTVARDNQFFVEQWMNWSFNTVASMAQLNDTYHPSKANAAISAACGMVMLGATLGAHKNSHGGDQKRAAFDILGQLANVIQDMSPVLAKDARTQGTIAVFGGTAAFTVGLAALVDSFERPDAQLG